MKSIAISGGGAVADFSRCPDEYQERADAKYLMCQLEQAEEDEDEENWMMMDSCTLLRELHRAKEFRRLFLAAIPLMLALAAILVNLLLAILCAHRLWWRRNGAGAANGIRTGASQAATTAAVYPIRRHRLALLLSRSVACVFACALLLVVLLAWRLGAFNYWSALIFLCVGIAQFLAMAGTNVTLSSLLYAAILHPLAYRIRMSMGRCYTLITTIWAFAIGASIPFAALGATLFYPESAPLHCPYHQCQWPLSLALVLLLTMAYALAIGCHVALLWQMHKRTRASRARVHPQTTNSPMPKLNVNKFAAIESVSLELNVRAMNRLSWNLLVFSLCKIPFIVISVVALLKLHPLSQLGLGNRSPCKTFLNGRLFFQVELLSSVAAIVWLLGMVLDPFIDVCLDSRFRHALIARLPHWCLSPFTFLLHAKIRESSE